MQWGGRLYKNNGVEALQYQYLDTGECILTLPQDILEKLGWEEGTVLAVSVKDGEITLERSQ